MTVKIKSINLSLNRATLNKNAQTRTRAFAGRFFNGRPKKQVQATVKRYAEAAILQVQRTLTSGVPGVGQSGVRRIFFNIPGAAAARYTTPVWNRLSYDYAIRGPRSTVFWRKHFNVRGRITSALGAPNTYRTLLGDYKAAVSSNVSVSSTRPRVEGTGERAYTVEWDVQIKPIKEPLNTMIIGSLLRGLPISERLATVNKRSIERIVYVEGRRPFIAGLSAQLGRRMRIELRSIT